MDKIGYRYVHPVIFAHGATEKFSGMVINSLPVSWRTEREKAIEQKLNPPVLAYATNYILFYI